MDKRINRCVELLEQDQAIYYDGPHSGHVLTHAQGRIDAGTWADYMNVGMEHGCFDMAGLAEYMRGMVDAGPTRSVIVEAPVSGIDAAHVRYNAWQPVGRIGAEGVNPPPQPQSTVPYARPHARGGLAVLLILWRRGRGLFPEDWHR